MLKSLRLATNIIKSNFQDLNLPYRFTYILTYKCQLKCNMCNIWNRPIQEELSLQQIKNFFQKSNLFSWINLSGGEIFLRKDLLDIIDTIVRKCKYLYLLDFPTNGVNTDAIVSVTKKILKYKIPKLLITISLDGPPDLHDQIRGIPGIWDKAVKTFAELRESSNRRFDVFFGMTLQASNLDKFRETVEAVNKNIGRVDYNNFHINIVQTSSHYYGNSMTYQDIDMDRFWKQMKEIIKLRKTRVLIPISYLESKYQKLSNMYLKDNIIPIPCQAFSSSFFMDPYGNIYPCSIYDKPIGNIVEFDYNIYKIWDSVRRKELRRLIKNKECPNCWTPCEAYQSIMANLVPKIKISYKK